MTLDVEWVDGRSGFAALADEWDAVLARGSRPFDLHCWHTAWIEAFAGGRELVVCTVRESGTLVGALPLMRDGRGVAAPANVHSCIFRPLAASPEAMEGLIAAVVEGSETLVLNELPDGDPDVERIAAEARAAGMVALLEPGCISPIVDTKGDLDAWPEQANASWIKRVRRYRRKMKKDHEATFAMIEPPTDLESDLAAVLALEASGWKGGAGTAIVSRPETEAFYRKVVAAFHARGELKLNRIVLDGELAACNVCIEHGGRIYALKTGYDERFRKIAPGLVMQVSLVEACFERGLDAYELLGNQAEWKSNLATSHRTHSTLRAYRRTPVGIGRYAYRTAVRPSLRRVYRRAKGMAR